MEWSPMMKNEGIKYDTGKLPFHLLPFDVLDEVVKVLQHGAAKYGIYGDCQCTVIAVKLSTVRGSVGLATSVTYAGGTLNITLGSVLIQHGGKKLILKSIGKHSAPTALKNDLSPTIAVEGPQPSTNLVWKNTSGWLLLPVGCVERLKSNDTLTMTIQQAGYVDHFVTAVISDLVSWKPARQNGSRLHSPGCPALEQVQTGDRNWEKGMKWSRLLSASLRHITAYARGIRRDPDTGLPTLAHAICCLLFLVAYELRGVGTDDVTPVVKEAKPIYVPFPPYYTREPKFML